MRWAGSCATECGAHVNFVCALSWTGDRVGRAGEGREEQMLSTSEDTLILGPNVRFQGKDSSRPSLGPPPSLSYPHQLREPLGLLSTRSQTRG